MSGQKRTLGLAGLVATVVGTVVARASVGHGGATSQAGSIVGRLQLGKVAPPYASARPSPRPAAKTHDAVPSGSSTPPSHSPPTVARSTKAPARSAVPATTTAVAPPSRATTSAAAPTNRTITGDAFDNPYGTVQVQLTMQGTRIVDVTALQLPSDQQRSQQISQYAGPQLRQEVLDAQSANIQGVSGASYTSYGYAQSVQSALSKA